MNADTLINSMKIRPAIKSDVNNLQIFLEEVNPFPGSVDDILNNAIDSRCKTLLLVDNNLSVWGFIQGLNTEIMFIAVNGELRRKGIGQKLFDEYCKLYAIDLPGIYVRVENDIAREFWAKIGFIQQSDYYWSLAFKRYSSIKVENNQCPINIAVISEIEPENIFVQFNTNAMISANKFVLNEYFIYYINSRDYFLYISIDSTLLEPKKIKYSDCYGVAILDNRWAVLKEVPLTAIQGKHYVK